LAVEAVTESASASEEMERAGFGPPFLFAGPICGVGEFLGQCEAIEDWLRR